MKSRLVSGLDFRDELSPAGLAGDGRQGVGTTDQRVRGWSHRCGGRAGYFGSVSPNLLDA
jgi:hypothetical protein